MTKKLIVYIENDIVGTLTRNDAETYTFRYESHWLESDHQQPLSLSLPLQEEPFAGNTARAFFSNLLPEGQLRDHYANKFRISPEDDFALLAKVAGDCAGAIALHSEGEKPLFDNKGHQYRALSEDDLTRLLAEPYIMDPSFLDETEQIRLSLAGVQEKLPIVIQNNAIRLPLNGAPSSYILKPQSHHFQSVVENELFCMALAQAMGLKTPRTTLLTLADETCYLIERYDRRYDKDGKLKRIHQEDFCQATSTSHRQKYEEQGGPGHRECFEIIKKCRNPLADRIKLINLTVFNYLICNADCHAKNISLLYKNGTHPDLAPCYDLVCTGIYPQLAKTFAMSIGGEFDPRNISRASWEEFSLQIGEGSAKPTLTTIKKMAGAINEKAQIVSEELTESYGVNPVYKQIVAAITERAEMALRQIQH